MSKRVWIIEGWQGQASSNKRSLNAELIARLEASFVDGEQSALDIENNSMLKALCAKLGVKAER
ncbi:Arc family DNA-binding protein [Pseudomonas chlororaphis]